MVILRSHPHHSTLPPHSSCPQNSYLHHNFLVYINLVRNFLYQKCLLLSLLMFQWSHEFQPFFNWDQTSLFVVYYLIDRIVCILFTLNTATRCHSLHFETLSCCLISSYETCHTQYYFSNLLSLRFPEQKTSDLSSQRHFFHFHFAQYLLCH